MKSRIIIILFLIVGSSGCIGDFSVVRRGCIPGSDPYSHPRAGVTGREWQGKTLVVKCFIKTYCSGAKIRGRYNVKGSTLLIEYSIKRSLSVSRCDCANRVEFRIKNLPRRDYRIKLVRSR